MRGEHPAGAVHPRPPEMGGQGGRGCSRSMPAARQPRWTRCGSFEAVLERWDADASGAHPGRRAAGTRAARGGEGARRSSSRSSRCIVQTPSAPRCWPAAPPGLDPVMVPTERYDRWRDAPLADRWALLATAWVGHGPAARAGGARGRHEGGARCSRTRWCGRARASCAVTCSAAACRRGPGDGARPGAVAGLAELAGADPQRRLRRRR